MPAQQPRSSLSTLLLDWSSIRISFPLLTTAQMGFLPHPFRSTTTSLAATMVVAVASGGGESLLTSQLRAFCPHLSPLMGNNHPPQTRWLLAHHQSHLAGPMECNSASPLQPITRIVSPDPRPPTFLIVDSSNTSLGSKIVPLSIVGRSVPLINQRDQMRTVMPHRSTVLERVLYT